MSRPVSSRSPRHVVAVRFSALGDVAMTIPVVYGLAAANPRTRFTVVTKRGNSRIFIGMPKNVSVIGIDLPGNPVGDARALWHTLSEAGRQVPVDMVVDLHDVLRTRLLKAICALRGIPFRRFDKARAAKRAVIAHKPGAIDVTPTVERYAEAFPPQLNAAKPFRGIYASSGGKGDPKAFEALCGPKRKGERWIGVAPFAAHPGKIYPPALMEKVVEELSWMGGTRVFLFGGGKSEVTTLTEWASGHPNVVCVAGSGIGFAGELSLMSWLDVMVAMDSGNMHLAALTLTPTVSIWGATSPALGFIPYTAATGHSKDRPANGPHTPRSIMIGAEMECRPCSAFGDVPCPHGTPRCLQAITPQRILTAVATLLGGNGGSAGK